MPVRHAAESDAHEALSDLLYLWIWTRDRQTGPREVTRTTPAALRRLTAAPVPRLPQNAAPSTPKEDVYTAFS